MTVDDFSFTWNKCSYFIFASFSLINRILHKNRGSQNKCSSCRPSLSNTDMIASSLKKVWCYLLPGTRKILVLEDSPGIQHLLRKMRLVASISLESSRIARNTSISNNAYHWHVAQQHKKTVWYVYQTWPHHWKEKESIYTKYKRNTWISGNTTWQWLEMLSCRNYKISS